MATEGDRRRLPENGNGENVVRITLRDVFDKVESMDRKVEALVAGAKITEDHENRLRSVEKKVYAIPSVATVLAIAGIIIGLLPGAQSSESSLAGKQVGGIATLASREVSGGAVVASEPSTAHVPAPTSKVDSQVARGVVLALPDLSFLSEKVMKVAQDVGVAVQVGQSG